VPSVSAVATELYVESGRWLLPLVLMVLAAAVAVLRRDRVVALLRRVRPGLRPGAAAD
jgi:hypothetical protein